MDKFYSYIKFCIEFYDKTAGIKLIDIDQYGKLHIFKFLTNKNSPTAIKWKQFPIIFCCACTLHKVQWFNLSNIVISFTLEKQRMFWRLHY